MARVYVFADEAGNFDFRNRPGASKNFIIGTVTLQAPDLGDRLLNLRRELAWQGVGLESSFHAAEDKQIVRDAVFKELQQAAFRFDCTILEKRKTQPHLAANKEHFYKMAWYLHFKYVGPRIVNVDDELLVVAASLGTKKRYRIMRAALEDVVTQAVWTKAQNYEVAFWPAESDPCLQVADYCTWAVQRLLELNDDRSHVLIKDKIHTQFEAFASGTTYYY